MPKLIFWSNTHSLALAAVPLLVLGTATSARAAGDNGRNVCYKVIEADGPGRAARPAQNERLVLNVDRQSPLTFPGGYAQTVYTAVGKNTDMDDGGQRTMAAALGTVIVTTKGGSARDFDRGAHMGVVAMWVRPDDSFKDFDCTSEQETATPTSWSCQVRDQNEGLRRASATLTLLPPAGDQFCGIFQDDVIEGPGRSRAATSGR